MLVACYINSVSHFSTMQLILINEYVRNRFEPLNIKKNIVGKAGRVSAQAQKCAGFKLVNGIPSLPL